MSWQNYFSITARRTFTLSNNFHLPHNSHAYYPICLSLRNNYKLDQAAQVSLYPHCLWKSLHEALTSIVYFLIARLWRRLLIPPQADSVDAVRRCVCCWWWLHLTNMQVYIHSSLLFKIPNDSYYAGPALGRFDRLPQIGPRGFQGPRGFFFVFFFCNLGLGKAPRQFFFLFSNLSSSSRI